MFRHKKYFLIAVVKKVMNNNTWRKYFATRVKLLTSLFSVKKHHLLEIATFSTSLKYVFDKYFERPKSKKKVKFVLEVEIIEHYLPFIRHVEGIKRIPQSSALDFQVNFISVIFVRR